MRWRKFEIVIFYQLLKENFSPLDGNPMTLSSEYCFLWQKYWEEIFFLSENKSNSSNAGWWWFLDTKDIFVDWQDLEYVDDSNYKVFFHY